MVKKKGDILFDDESIFGEIPDEEFLPPDILEQNEKRKDILRIIDNLPDGQRICIMLYYFEDNSVATIAQQLDCSVNTVKSRLAYARKTIKEAVLTQEKKGNKIHGILPVLTNLFNMEVEATHIPEEISSKLFSNMLEGIKGASISETSGMLLKFAALSGKVKSAIVITSLVVVAAGAAVPFILNYEKEKAEEVEAQIQAQQLCIEAEATEKLRIEEEKIKSEAEAKAKVDAAAKLEKEAAKVESTASPESKKPKEPDDGTASAPAVKPPAKTTTGRGENPDPNWTGKYGKIGAKTTYLYTPIYVSPWAGMDEPDKNKAIDHTGYRSYTWIKDLGLWEARDPIFTIPEGNTDRDYTSIAYIYPYGKYKDKCSGESFTASIWEQKILDTFNPDQWYVGQFGPIGTFVTILGIDWSVGRSAGMEDPGYFNIAPHLEGDFETFWMKDLGCWYVVGKDTTHGITSWFDTSTGGLFFGKQDIEEIPTLEDMRNAYPSQVKSLTVDEWKELNGLIGYNGAFEIKL